MPNSQSPGSQLAQLVSSNPVGTTRVAFVSDLHLLSSRCDFERHATSVRRAVQQCDVCVWGGDLFDFHWSCAGDAAESQKIAIGWLEKWRAEFPDKTFIYLTGNHDAQVSFQNALAEWASVHSSESFRNDVHSLPVVAGAIYVGLDAVRFGDCLLTHGDVIESLPKSLGHQVSLETYRSRWQHERVGFPRPPIVRNQLYNAAVKARFHLATARVAHRNRRVCLRLLRWVKQQPDWVGNGLERIVFGHTHRRLNGQSVAGTLFYNGGAAVRHVQFEPICISV